MFSVQTQFQAGFISWSLSLHLLNTLLFLESSAFLTRLFFKMFETLFVDGGSKRGIQWFCSQTRAFGKGLKTRSCQIGASARTSCTLLSKRAYRTASTATHPRSALCCRQFVRLSLILGVGFWPKTTSWRGIKEEKEREAAYAWCWEEITDERRGTSVHLFKPLSRNGKPG